MFRITNKEDNYLVNKCLVFIEDVLKNRDWSHGIEHSKQVAINAVDIWNYGEKEKYNKIKNKQKLEVNPLVIIIYAALLHDVSDHKYKTESTISEGMNELVTSLGENSSIVIYKIIKNVSYSNQLKNGIEKMQPDILLLRNIVSDADKLEALGEIGFKRCIFYQKEIGCNNTDEQNLKNAKKHIETKILNIYPDFLHTDYGKKIGNERKNILKTLL